MRPKWVTLILNIQQVHTGVEVDFIYDATENVRFIGMTSVGNWEYAGTANGTFLDQNQDPVQPVTLDLDGIKVGDAAQFTARMGIDIDVTEDFSIDYS